MESGIEALNKIKETRDRFLAMQKLSKEIFNETITKLNELKDYHEQITSNKILLQEKKSTIPTLERRNRLLDEQVVTLETILGDKKQRVAEQEDLLKKDQQGILLARSLHCDRVYDFIEKVMSESELFVCEEQEDETQELKEFIKQVQNCEGELGALNENILSKESALNDLQLTEKFQKEKLRFQELLEEKKKTLRNLIQQVKNLKLNLKKAQLNRTIENLYHQNGNENHTSVENISNEEVSNYFNHSTNINDLKQSDTLNKIKYLCAIRGRESNSKSTGDKTKPIFVSNQNEFDDNSMNQSEMFRKLIPETELAVLPNEESSKLKQVPNIARNSRKKFFPKKPHFSQKLV